MGGVGGWARACVCVRACVLACVCVFAECARTRVCVHTAGVLVRACVRRLRRPYVCVCMCVRVCVCPREPLSTCAHVVPALSEQLEV